jgi:allantoicase
VATDPRDVLVGEDLQRPHLEQFACEGWSRERTRAGGQRWAIVALAASQRVTSR